MLTDQLDLKYTYYVHTYSECSLHVCFCTNMESQSFQHKHNLL